MKKPFNQYAKKNALIEQFVAYLHSLPHSEREAWRFMRCGKCGKMYISNTGNHGCDRPNSGIDLENFLKKKDLV